MCVEEDIAFFQTASPFLEIEACRRLRGVAGQDGRRVNLGQPGRRRRIPGASPEGEKNV